MHDDCCCQDSETGDVVLTDTEPCCEKAVSLGIDSATEQAQNTAKPVKFQSDVYSPDIVVSGASVPLQSLQTPSVSSVNDTATTNTTENVIYLITQRLRI